MTCRQSSKKKQQNQLPSPSTWAASSNLLGIFSTNSWSVLWVKCLNLLRKTQTLLQKQWKQPRAKTAKLFGNLAISIWFNPGFKTVFLNVNCFFFFNLISREHCWLQTNTTSWSRIGKIGKFRKIDPKLDWATQSQSKMSRLIVYSSTSLNFYCVTFNWTFTAATAAVTVLLTGILIILKVSHILIIITNSELCKLVKV